MAAHMLYEPPCTDYNPNGLEGAFEDNEVEKIINILAEIRSNSAA